MSAQTMDVLERLSAYVQPGRFEGARDRRITVDILDAKNEIELLRARVTELLNANNAEIDRIRASRSLKCGSSAML